MEKGKFTETQVHGHVATVWLSHPPLNLVTEAMKDELLTLLDVYERDDRVRVLILTGAGDQAFCAGRDLRQTRSWQASADPPLDDVWDRGNRLMDRILFYPKLTIAAVNGVALGGGCELTLPCDLVIAGRAARIGLPEAMRGVFPGTGGMKLLAKKVGLFRAREMVFLGRVLTADEAQVWGLVNMVTDRPAREAAVECAEGLRRVSFQAVIRAKRVMNRHEPWPDAGAMHYEREQFRQVFLTPDAREGVKAFFEKRGPQFDW